MLQVTPQRNLPLVWHSADPNDTDTLFVQAVVKDASTLAVLSTVNLTDNGSQLFSGSVTTPPDTSQTGTGRWIIVVFTIFSDSGYTTPSLNYARVTETYLVKTLINANQLYGGGGSSIDYAMLKKLVGEVLDEKKTPIKFPEIPKVDLANFKKELLTDVKNIVESIVGGIPTPEKPEKVDLSSLDSGLKTVIKEITSRPKFQPTDLSGLVMKIHTAMNEMMTMHEDNKKEMLKYFEKFKEEIINSISDENAKLKLLNGIRDGSIGFQMLNSPEQEKKKGYLKSLAAKYNL